MNCDFMVKVSFQTLLRLTFVPDVLDAPWGGPCKHVASPFHHLQRDSEGEAGTTCLAALKLGLSLCRKHKTTTSLTRLSLPSP